MTQTRKTKSSTQKANPSRVRHSEGFKLEALLLAEKIGVQVAAEQLGLPPSQLYGWRSQAKLLKSHGEIDDGLKAENARLERPLAEKEQELAFLGKTASYFAKIRK